MDNPLESLLPPPDFKDNDSQLTAKKIRYQALVDITKATYESALRSLEGRELEELKAQYAELAADWENGHLLDQAIYNAYIEVSKNQVSERMNRADFVQKTAAAISAAYVAVLGLSYSVQYKAPLPSRGFVPALFLGLAIFLSAVYAAFLTDSGEMKWPSETQNLGDNKILQFVRLQTFMRWTILPVLKRKFMLQAAVVSLGFSAIFLPLPYLALPDWSGLIAAGVGLVGIFVIPALLSVNRVKNPHLSGGPFSTLG